MVLEKREKTVPKVMPAGPHEHVFVCPHHPEVLSDKPGRCPKCGSELVKGEKPPEFYWTCPMEEHRDVISDKPGKCPKCGMDLVKMERKAPAAERIIYVCDLHRDEAFDKPGECNKEGCDGMTLEARRIPEGSQLVYECPLHPGERSPGPAACKRTGVRFDYRVLSSLLRPIETWACPVHPERTSDDKVNCVECGTSMKHYEFEQSLAVPASAVIDTGARTVVFVDRAHGTYDSVEVTLGHRAGEYYQVLKGLAAGDKVVTAGAFLLDAETRLNPAAGAAFFGASDSGAKGGGGHEGH